MLTNIRKLITCSIMLWVILLPSSNANVANFSYDKASQQLANFSEKVSKDQFEVDKAAKSLSELEKYYEQAIECVEVSQQKLAKLNRLESLVKKDVNDTAATDLGIPEFDKKKKSIKKQLLQCRLYAFHYDELVLEQYEEISKIKKPAFDKFGYSFAGVATKTVLSIAVLLALFTLHKVSTALFLMLTNTQNSHIQKLYNLLNMKSHHTFIELYVCKAALYLFYLFLGVLAFVWIWTNTDLHTELVIKAFQEGFYISNLRVMPQNIILALISFSSVLFVGRLVSSYFSKQYVFSPIKEQQVAIASILIYIFSGLALLFALMVSGVDLTGLAIIAGALSVGLGFGLQNIVNNFICGLILLIQKPIKSGDRVLVGDKEGVIVRVRLLSTQIKTMEREDVIIPNSDLINSPVTNYMFRDALWRVTCSVGVAYGSNVELVKQLLLEVAEEHELVVKTSPHQPTVLFKAFGDSSFEFELWVIITDVNKKYQVQSDLNFSINERFANHNIVIAFPQRDIHIKSGGNLSEP